VTVLKFAGVGWDLDRSGNYNVAFFLSHHGADSRKHLDPTSSCHAVTRFALSVSVRCYMQYLVWENS
jgi:hypothetical protein